MHITIYPGTVGGGLRIWHVGDYVHIGPNCRIGRHCDIVSGVVFGNKSQWASPSCATVGDNCHFGIGARILGAVRIGDNVTVGANSVVTKDIPSNCVVGGIPSKVIRMTTVAPTHAEGMCD